MMHPTKNDRLKELKILLDKYNETVEEFYRHRAQHMQQEHNEHFVQLLHELRGQLIHIETLKNQTAQTDDEKTAAFLTHHLDAVSHATEIWHHIHHHIAEANEAAEELEEIHDEIQHICLEIEKEQIEEAENVVEENKHQNDKHN